MHIPSASPILGYTAAELLGSNGYNFYHDEDLNGLARSHVDCEWVKLAIYHSIIRVYCICAMWHLIFVIISVYVPCGTLYLLLSV